MGDLTKFLERFLARDLIFITGGGVVIASFLHAADRLPTERESAVFYALLIGIAYFVGIAVQDAFSLLGLVTTATVRDLHEGRFCAVKLWLYERFNRRDRTWRRLDGVNLERQRENLSSMNNNKDALDRLERIVTLKQVGTTGGPCAIVASVLLLIRFGNKGDTFDGWLGLAALIVAVPLIITSWIRGGQQAQQLAGPADGGDTAGAEAKTLR